MGERLVIAMGGEGILFDHQIPVYINKDSEELVGVLIFPIDINKFNKTFLWDKKALYIMSTASGNIAGASRSAVNTLDIKIADYNYLKQEKTNPTLGDEFKYKSNANPGIQELGKKVMSGEKEFEVKIKGKTYLAVVEDIEEVKFKLVGLLER